MDININEIRSNFEKLGNQYSSAENIQVEKDVIETIPCYWFYKGKLKSSSSIIIYLHGGCYAFGSINSHKAMVSHLAHALNATILFVEYSLAPENPFPAARNEVLRIYNYLINKKHVQEISFMGDSAGGGLTISVVSVLNLEKNTSNLGKIIMISPWIDLRNHNPSMSTNKYIDPILTKEGLDYFSSIYISDQKMEDTNPMETMSGDFPPTLIQVGSNEILVDDSREFYSKISNQQTETGLTIYKNQTHVWLMGDIQSESSVKAISEIKKFMGISTTG